MPGAAEPEFKVAQAKVAQAKAARVFDFADPVTWPGLGCVAGAPFGTTVAMGLTAQDVRSVDQLREFIGNGGQPKYLMFWGHQPLPGNQVGKPCLSQWWPAEFTIDGVAYASAEHFMMASKARLFGDDEAVPGILAAPHPREAKVLGRKIRGFDDETWARHRFSLVVEGNVAKFGQHAALRDFLLSTGSRVLVEASPRDRIWGIGLGANNELSADPGNWRGLNLLGFALMEARCRLRALAANAG